MKILVAPNSFKGALSSSKAAVLLATELAKSIGKENVIPMAISDGGDGFLEACAERYATEQFTAEISAPWQNEKLIAPYLYAADKQQYIIETAKVFGHALTPPEKRQPLLLSSAGLGELILHIMGNNLRESETHKFLLGLGGSIINDFGIGAASLFGLSLMDEAGAMLPPVPASFRKARHIIVPKKIPHTHIELVADVEAEPIGPNGCTFIFGPQKGASPEICSEIEEGILNVLDILLQEHGIDFNGKKIGAAGGVAMGLSLISECNFNSADSFIMETLGIDEALVEADVVVTGEGRVDVQTMMHKAPGVIMNASLARRKKVILICGDIADGIRFSEEFVQVIRLRDFFPTTEESILRTEEGLVLAAKKMLVLLGL